MNESVNEKLKIKERFSTRRVEALSDGVFAFAMTLLVLNIAIPSIRSINTNAELWQALRDQMPAFISFVVSFFILAAMWGVHMRQFESLEKVDRRFVFINNLRLLSVIFVAFSTGLAGNYPNLELARMILPINFFILAVISSWQGHYATSVNPPLISNTDKAEIKRHDTRSMFFVFFAGVVVAGSYFVGTLAFAIFILMPLVIKLTERKDK